MNLEDIEQRCLRHLTQAANPLVSFEDLVNHLRADDAGQDFSERDLLAFLEKHDLVRVLETPSAEDAPELPRQLADAGIPAGLNVILRSRIPPPGVLAEMIEQQLATMSEALQRALLDARDSGDTEVQRRVADALERAEKLKEIARKTFADAP